MQACSHPIIALCTILLATPTVRASNPQIVGYDSGSDVRQHSYIDLDQRDMEKYLGSTPKDYEKAKNIYSLGGNSGGYAEITLTTGLAGAHAKGVVVSQGTKTGTLKSAAAAGATMIKVSYPTPSTCKDGGYTANADGANTDTSLHAVTTGCFTVAGGAITVDGTDVGVPAANGVVNKYRTLKGFSTQAEAKMKMQETFQVYRAYYGAYDYANQYVLGAFGATGGFANLGDDARTQGVKKGTAYMNVWMYVIHEIEDAITDCENNCITPGSQDCNSDPVHAIDEAAAFYAGSLEGVAAKGVPDAGKLVFRLAEKRCADFGTCTGTQGQAAANAEIVAKLQRSQIELKNSRCVNVVPLKKRIVELMSIPLIQGSIRYAYKVAEESGGLKEKAEGAVFSAAILPRVAACNPDVAELISDNMKINAANHMSAGFVAIKQAFESTYACLGITCEDIGGLLKSKLVMGEYKDKAAPCVTSSPSQTISETNIPGWTIAVIIVIAVALIFACTTTALFFSQANKYKKMANQPQASGEYPVGQPQDA